MSQNFDNTAHPQQSSSWLWGRSVTHFQWYQFHPIHLFILKPFETAEYQNRTSQAGYCSVSAELESKSKNWWDFKMPSKEKRHSLIQAGFAAASRKNRRRVERILQPQQTRPGDSSTPPQHGMKDPAEPARELLPPG